MRDRAAMDVLCTWMCPKLVKIEIHATKLWLTCRGLWEIELLIFVPLTETVSKSRSPDPPVNWSSESRSKLRREGGKKKSHLLTHNVWTSSCADRHRANERMEHVDVFIKTQTNTEPLAQCSDWSHYGDYLLTHWCCFDLQDETKHFCWWTGEYAHRSQVGGAALLTNGLKRSG